jgi:hypothetical protein
VNDSTSSGRHRAPEVAASATISLYDHRVQLHVDRANVTHYIEFHEDSPPAARHDMILLARSRGLVPDDGGRADPYDNAVPVGEFVHVPGQPPQDSGVLRLYLVTADTIPDIPFQRSSMPDLSPTAYGPFSGFMEAVTT